MFGKSNTNEILESLKSQMVNMPDVEFHELKFNGIKINLVYIISICKLEIIQENIIKPIFNVKDLKHYEECLLSFPHSLISNERQEVMNKILKGWAAVFSEHEVLLIYAKTFLESDISESQSESIIQGPKDALQEGILTNLNLIRNRCHNKNLIIEDRELSLAKIPAVILYDKQLVDKSILNELSKEIKDLQTKSFHSAHELHKRLMKKTSRFVPTILMTDRPDRIIKNIGEGKVILIIEGLPLAMILPAVFFDFMSAMEEVYQLPAIGKFLIFLRYVGLLVTIILPGFYIGMSTYNPELFRFQLALSISGNRAIIPYPSFVEVIAMLVMMELLTEASSRLPKVIGPTATTVGGLILGQAAAEAGLVSNIMVIIVSAVAISNYIIPIYSMNFVVRIAKYVILMLSIFFGLIGIVVGLIGFVFYLANIRSYGKPYLQLFSDKLRTTGNS